MSEFTLRAYRASDRPQAVSLWNRVFGDPEPVVEQFLDQFETQPGFCAVAESNGILAAAAYCLDGLRLCLPGQTSAPGCYLYAVATDPDFRSQGLAARLCRTLQEWAFQRNNRYLFTRPAQPSLFPWYEEKIGAIPALPCRTFHVMAPMDAPALEGKVLTVPEYAAARERLLSDTCHVAMPESFFQWEHQLHQAYGGTFVSVGDGIADVYCDGNTAEIQELLVPENSQITPEAAAAAVMAYLGVPTGKVTMPGTQSAYVSCAAANSSLPEDIFHTWFGPIFG